MKNLFYIFLGVVIVYLISVIYRGQATPILAKFPIEEIEQKINKATDFYLVLFFTKSTCSPCVQQIVDLLNKLPENIRVVGIIKKEDLIFLDEIRNFSGAKFPIKTIKKWERFRPNYVPTVFGVGQDGRIYFILACVGIEHAYLRAYLDELLRKYNYLMSKPNLK
jgi:hypothetical protein